MSRICPCEEREHIFGEEHVRREEVTHVNGTGYANRSLRSTDINGTYSRPLIKEVVLKTLTFLLFFTILLTKISSLQHL